MRSAQCARRADAEAVISPAAEVLGYVLVPLLWALGMLSVQFLIAFLALSFSLGLAVSAGAFMLQQMELRRFTRTRDLIILFVTAVLENFGYRQLNNVWRLRGLWEYLRGHRHWGRWNAPLWTLGLLVLFLA